jgi:hypothetical protein
MRMETTSAVGCGGHIEGSNRHAIVLMECGGLVISLVYIRSWSLNSAISVDLS